MSMMVLRLWNKKDKEILYKPAKKNNINKKNSYSFYIQYSIVSDFIFLLSYFLNNHIHIIYQTCLLNLKVILV